MANRETQMRNLRQHISQLELSASRLNRVISDLGQQLRTAEGAERRRLARQIRAKEDELQDVRDQLASRARRLRELEAGRG